eukprot:1635491-Prymnesium_polylepis.1
MFGVQASGFLRFNRTQFTAVYQALREINNKNDGLEDWLLPTTRIDFAFRDSKCDLLQGMIGAQSLLSAAFQGNGVHAIIGAACPTATVPAAELAAQSKVPMLSPSVDSSMRFGGGRASRYFLRMVPPREMVMDIMAGILKNVLEYSHVVVVHDQTSADVQPFSASAAAYELTQLAYVKMTPVHEGTDVDELISAGAVGVEAHHQDY